MRKEWQRFAHVSEVVDALSQDWHREAQSEDAAARWLEDAVFRAWIALEASDGGDRAAWLRELVRLHGGTLTLSPEIVGDVPEHLRQRFGLLSSSLQDHCVLRLTKVPDFQRLPAHLISQLEHALPIDPNPRRRSRDENPDGVLLRCSPHQRYRSTAQKAAVRAICTMPPGQSLLVTMPTGSGKSLLFQLGVRWWNECSSEEECPCILVIVPTLALAEDHARTLRGIAGLEGSRALTGAMGHNERNEIYGAFLRGEVPILLTSPEAALGSAREALIRASGPAESRPLAEQGRLAAIFVDEVHIVHSWGRSFRPDFQRLPGLVDELRSINPALRTVLLSATVEQDAKDLLVQHYGQGGQLLEIAAQVPRTEFDLCIHHFEDAKERDQAVLAVADLLPRPAIIYTTEVAGAEALGSQLRHRGYNRLAVFSGDTGPEERIKVIEKWQNGTLDLVVATSAFGMGIDKSDLRSVLHACLPENASRLYQEIGRAGRDGHQALAVVLAARADESLAVRMSTGGVLTTEKARERWHSMVETARKEDCIGFSKDGCFLQANLNAHLERLGPRTGQQHRRWNKALLVQLQRYGALEVLSLEEERDRCSTKILDPRLLNLDADADELLDTYLACRAQEIGKARGRVKRLLKFIHSASQLQDNNEKSLRLLNDFPCLLLGLYEQVEESREIPEACGRCLACRLLEEQPPRHVEHQGGLACWESPLAKPVAFKGTRLVFTEDNEYQRLEALLQELVQVGVAQFIVSSRQVEQAAQVLSSLLGQPGLILEATAIVKGRWRSLPIPTALLLDPSFGPQAQEQLYNKTRDQVLAGPNAALVLVAPFDLSIGGRCLSQIASKHAPLRAAALLSQLGDV